MSQLKPREVESALLNKGFKKIDGGRDHHFYFYFHNGIKTSVFTKISHNSADIGDPLLKLMCRQLRLAKKAEFLELVKCSLSQDQYAEILVAGKHISIDS